MRAMWIEMRVINKENTQSEYIVLLSSSNCGEESLSEEVQK